jgi:hypothetical protein
VDWAEQSRFYLRTETDSSLQNVVFLIEIGRWIMSKKKFILTINHRHKTSDVRFIVKRVTLFFNTIPHFAGNEIKFQTPKYEI